MNNKVKYTTLRIYCYIKLEEICTPLNRLFGCKWKCNNLSIWSLSLKTLENLAKKWCSLVELFKLNLSVHSGFWVIRQNSRVVVSWRGQIKKFVILVNFCGYYQPQKTLISLTKVRYLCLCLTYFVNYLNNYCNFYL